MGMFDNFTPTINPNNKYKFIEDKRSVVVQGATSHIVFEMYGMKVSDIKDLTIYFKMGLEPFVEKHINQVTLEENKGILFIKTTLFPQETKNVVFNRELKAQVKVVLLDDSVFFSEIDNIKIVPSVEYKEIN